MFTRTHRIGRHAYTEALESHRDPETGKPRHRCIARWRAESSLAEELGKTRFAIERASKSVAYYQGVIDRTVRPRFWKHIKWAPESLEHWRRDLQTEMSHFAALTEARDKGLPADDGEIEQAAQTHASRWAALTTRANAVDRSAPMPDLAGLADRVRRLATQNDPNAIRTELAEIAAALDAAIALATLP
jgi:hypothetical protein